MRLTASRVSPALLTDLYELTMLQAYREEGMEEEAVFSLFVRRVPEHRNYLLACGLDDVLRQLEELRFDEAALGYLESQGFPDPFLRYLEGFRFRGDVFGLPEGTPFFADEPLVEVVAPVCEAQFVETLVMNQMHVQTVIASKAARVVAAARGRQVVDFGMRRTHGIDAALKSARAAFVAGVDATSNVAAGQAYGIPIAGTMAHSYVEAHDDEYEAFRRFVATHPETVLLVDTYDTEEGVRKVVELARELGGDFRVKGVRLDSGDLAELARRSREILDAAGLESVEIFASGGLGEQAIADLLDAGAPIDAFGVGTTMGVAVDAPGLDIAYKLVAYAGRGRLKLSSGKATLPGRKQVFRVENGGAAVRDVIGRHDEALPGRPLLRQVMKEGRRTEEGREDLRQARERARREIARLPAEVRALTEADPPFPVAISPKLARSREEVRRRVAGQVERVRR
jgi:nicotinate phosphoribosyltransferase